MWCALIISCPGRTKPLTSVQREDICPCASIFWQLLTMPTYLQEMSDAMEEHAHRVEADQPGQMEARGPDQPASQPSLLPSAHLRSLAGTDANLGNTKPAMPVKSSLSADASSAATHGCALPLCKQRELAVLSQSEPGSHWSECDVLRR